MSQLLMKVVAKGQDFKISDLEPCVDNNCVYVPVALENKTSKPRGLFKFFTEENTQIITYRVYESPRAKQTVELQKQAKNVKRFASRPKLTMFVATERTEICIAEQSEKLCEYEGFSLYQDKHGYWYTNNEKATNTRITDKSALDAYMTHKKYQKQMKNYYTLMNKARENITLIKETSFLQ